MQKDENFDPPPPYSAINFTNLNQTSYAPQFAPSVPPPNVQSAPPPPAVVQQIVQLVNAPPVGPRSTRLVCPTCHESVNTKLAHEASCTTHFVCLLLCMLQCYWCCLVPYCMPACQNAIHSCPKCGAYIGTY